MTRGFAGYVLAFTALFSGSARLWAQDDLSTQVKELEKRIAEQEARMAEQQKKIADLEVKVTPEELKKAQAAAAKSSSQQKPVLSALDIQIYGYIKVDAAFDTDRIDVGNFARWVASEEMNDDDEQFNLTANQTRLDLKVTGPELGGGTPSGLVEIDFYGGGTAENKPSPMMRHAYLKMDWPSWDFNVLAGQTFDLISPLYQDTVNYTVGWWVGNIGYRRPQIRVTKGFGMGQGFRLELATAIARTIGRTSGFDPGDSGEDSGFPTSQTRIGLTLPILGIGPTALGVSGHYAQEEYDTDAWGNNADFESWSINVDITQPVTKWLNFKAEGFTGEDLDAYLGGIGQGVNTASGEEITSYGGWVTASLGPFEKWLFNLGASAEKVKESEIADGSRSVNRVFFGNVYYQIFPSTSVALEVSHWLTDYRRMEDGDGLRVQLAFIFKF